MSSREINSLQNTVRELNRLMQQLKKGQDENAKRIAEITGQISRFGTELGYVKLLGENLAKAWQGRQPLGVAVPVIAAFATGVGRGMGAASWTQQQMERMRRAEIRFGTEADRQRWHTRNAMELALRLLIG